MTGYGSKCVFLNSLTTPGCAHPSNGGELATYRRGLKFPLRRGGALCVVGRVGAARECCGDIYKKKCPPSVGISCYYTISRKRRFGLLGVAIFARYRQGFAVECDVYRNFSVQCLLFGIGCFFCALFASGVNTYGVCRQVRPLRFYVICNSLCTGTPQCVVIANFVFGANIEIVLLRTNILCSFLSSGYHFIAFLKQLIISSCMKSGNCLTNSPKPNV